MRFNRRAFAFLVEDDPIQEAVLENCLILLHEQEVLSTKGLLPLVEQVGPLPISWSTRNESTVHTTGLRFPIHFLAVDRAGHGRIRR
jgi:hypothetical protein